MDSDRREDSGEMYSPDDQGEYMSLERVGSWRWSVEPERRGSPLDLLVGPPNLAPIFRIPDVKWGGGHNSSNRYILFGTISRGHYNPNDDDPKWKPEGGAKPPCASL